MDLLLRLGYTVGDQTDLARTVELGSLKPILGTGVRLGLLFEDGRGPAESGTIVLSRSEALVCTP